ncbi:MAG: tRNA (adenosine(37)-N6)-threonylcarbamoyltransferase complex dimerization subunit type 1 TsaB [Hyphomicrobiales bacterium]|nr:tRNA (adenosine(37)-N6)-threonylcarbamoyltransferase complex dimerization subunit type 1 TsaB [Hyphomicrobiales bacterium]
MRILAIDTSVGAASAGVFDVEGDCVEVARERRDMARGHAEALLPMVERVMAAAPGGFAGVDRIAVTVGPGSFTGIRVGIAAARAFGLACEAPVIGVSTLVALAAPLLAVEAPGLAVAAIDARHGNFYVHGFSPVGRTLLSPRFCSGVEAVRQLGAGPFRLTGDGARGLAEVARLLGGATDLDGDLVAPDVAYVARIAALSDPARAPALPMYLKAPDVTAPAAAQR